MKCSNCGFEQDNDFSFCPECGSPSGGGGPEINDPDQGRPKVTFSAKTNGEEHGFRGETPYSPYQPQPVLDISTMNPWQRANAFCRDGTFLGACILLSVNTVLSLITIIPFGVSVIKILITIFFWIAYANAYKYRLEAKHIKWISGTWAAYKIIQYVICGLVVVAGIICMVIFNSPAMNRIFEEVLSRTPRADMYYDMVTSIMSASGVFVLVMCIIIAAVIFLFTFFGIRSLHLFVKSVYKSIESGTFEIQKRNATAAWLIVYAVFAGIGAIGGIINIIGLIGSVTMCVTYILLSILVNRYYKDM